MVAGKTSYELSWEVQSFVPIQEYRLLYRRIDMVSTVQCSTKKVVQPCLCSEFSKFHWIPFNSFGCELLISPNPPVSWGVRHKAQIKVASRSSVNSLCVGSGDRTCYVPIISDLLFQKSGTRIKVDAGSDWTNVIIPGDDHKYYSSKQVTIC